MFSCGGCGGQSNGANHKPSALHRQEINQPTKSKRAPLAVVAFANEVAAKTVRPKQTDDCFNGLTTEVPPRLEEEEFNNPRCHSATGQKLLCVDWPQMHGPQAPCPDGARKGTMQNDRSDCSKNETLFPAFHLEGPPSWCVTVTMARSCCRRRFDSNEGNTLVNLPDHAADACPVDAQVAFPNFGSHLSRQATQVFSSIMLTHGDGQPCSKLLHNAINRLHVRRLKSCCSKAETPQKKPLPHAEKNGAFVKTFPPLGDAARDMFDQASSSQSNLWRTSDCDRRTRETQSASCTGVVFAQDHAFEATKNCQKRTGAKAAWTVGAGTGEIAAVALVPSTKTEDFAHAAKQLLD